MSDGILPTSRDIYVCLSLTSSYPSITFVSWCLLTRHLCSIPQYLYTWVICAIIPWCLDTPLASGCLGVYVVAILWNMTPNSSIPVSKLWVAQGDGRGGMVIAWGPCGSPGGRWCARLPGQPWWPLPVWHPMCRLLQLSLVFGQPRLCSWWWPQMIGRIMQHCSCAE